jgi:hypothetical protein
VVVADGAGVAGVLLARLGVGLGAAGPGRLGCGDDTYAGRIKGARFRLTLPSRIVAEVVA